MDSKEKGITGLNCQEVIFCWAVAEDVYPAELAEFFIQNTDQSYISHGEVFTGRSTLELKWAGNLKEVLMAEIKEILNSDPLPEESYRIGLCYCNGFLAGMAICALKNSTSLAIIEDIIINEDKRGNKLGYSFLQWIESELKETGITACFLESSIKNNDAHRFFEKNGYSETSRVFMKRL